MKFASLLVSASLLISSLSFAQKNDVVAVIGTKKITVEEFNKKYDEVRRMTANPPSKTVFLEDLVRFEVGVQEATKRGMENDPIVQEKFKQEMYKAMIEKDIGMTVQKIQVTEKEMQEWYKNNPEFRSSHILIEFKPGSSPEQIAEAKKRATEIWEEVQKSKRPFEELVKLYSDDTLSKQAGGDVGWQSRVTLVPSYYDALVKMKMGEVRGLIETRFGFHIVKLTGQRSYENADKRQIRPAVFDEKRKAIFNGYFDKLKKGYSIKTNPELLK